MKKILSSIFFLLFLGNFAYASCSKELEWSWKYTDTFGTHVKKDKASSAKFEFKSTSEKNIKINYVVLRTNDHRDVVRSKESLNLRPFGKGDLKIYYLNEINLDVVKGGTFSCNYSTLTQNKKSSGTTVYDLLEKEKNKKKKFSNKNDNKSGSRSLLEKLLGNN